MNLRGKLFGNAGIYLGANIANAAIPFLLLPILTRVLTPAEYGTVAMFVVMVSIFNSFTGLSVHGAISIRYFQLSKEALAEYVTSCIGILIVSTCAVLAIVVLFERWLVPLSGLPLDWLIIAVLVSGLQFLVSIRLALWQVAGKAWHYGGFQISRSLLDALLSLLLILGFSWAWQGRVIGSSVATLLMGIVALIWLYKEQMLRRTVTWRIHSKDALHFGLPLIPTTIGRMLVVVADRIIISNVLDDDAVGLYMIALQLGVAISMLTEAFNTAYAPWLYKNLSNDKIHSTIVKGTYIYFIVILLIAAGYGLVVPSILDIVLGEAFSSSGGLVIYIAIGYAFSGCYLMVVNYIFVANKTKYLIFVVFLAGILNIPITYYLTMKMQLEGAGIAFIITHMLIFFLGWFFSHRSYDMPWMIVTNKKT